MNMNNADKEYLVQKIRTQYTEKEYTTLKVKRPVNVFSYTFGTVSALILGAGMSLRSQRKDYV